MASQAVYDPRTNLYYFQPLEQNPKEKPTSDYGGITRAVTEAVDENLYPKDGDDLISRLVEKVGQLWEQNKAEFATALEPFIRSGEVDKLAYHIFNLYRRDVIMPILTQLHDNSSNLGISQDEWKVWEPIIIKCAWRHIKNAHSSSVAVALDTFLKKEFPQITPKSPYYPPLSCCGQGVGLPKLRPLSLKLDLS